MLTAPKPEFRDRLERNVALVILVDVNFNAISHLIHHGERP
jgi:hypothetical protein